MVRKKIVCTVVTIVSLMVCACGTSGSGGGKSSGNDTEKKKPGSSFDGSFGGGSGENSGGNQSSQSGNGSMDDAPGNTGSENVYTGGNLFAGETGHGYTFLEEVGEDVLYDEGAMDDFIELLKSDTAEYGYDKLFDVDKSLEGVNNKVSITSHSHSALDDNGKLTKEHYFELVKKNTTEYMNTKPMMKKTVEDALIREVCDVIVDVVNEVLSVYPDIDKERVYCNLGQVKIGYDLTSTSYAYVSEDMFVHVNKSFSNSASGTDGDGFYRIIVHETMHLLQLGCLCEKEQINGRRLGVSCYYFDWDTQYADWTWLGEGSAERMSNLYTGEATMTYPENIAVIRTMDVIAALREDLPANYVETISFYSDADKVFSLFDISSEEEVCNMMYAFEIALEEPGTLQTDYPRLYGTSWTSDEAEKVKYTLENTALITLTKQFYYALCNAIRENKLTKNDVLFLVALHESSAAQMTRMGLNRYKGYCGEFTEWYTPVRDSFFALFENMTKADFNAYSSGNKKTGIHASFSGLSESKVTVIMKKYESLAQEYRIK